MNWDVDGFIEKTARGRSCGRSTSYNIRLEKSATGDLQMKIDSIRKTSDV